MEIKRGFPGHFGAGDGIRTRDTLLGGQDEIAKMVNKMTISQIAAVDNIRDKDIIALFVESGIRLSELANIKPNLARALYKSARKRS